MNNNLIGYLVTLSSIDHPNPRQLFPINIRVLTVEVLETSPKSQKIHFHIVPVNCGFRF